MTSAPELTPSATLEMNERSAALIASGHTVYRLGLGQSPFPVPPHIVQALIEHASEKDYLPVRGLLALRRSIVSWLARTEGIKRDADHVMIGPGSKELLFIAQLAAEAELLLPSPSWVSYSPQAQLIGRAVQWIPTHFSDDLKITADALEGACLNDPKKRRLLILNSPCNPTGGCYSEQELLALSEVARAYGVLVISDEIYSGVQFRGLHRSLARFYPEGTLISNGLSKWAGAGGWRLGFMSAPPELSWLIERMSCIASETFTSVSAPIQYAAVSAFSEHHEMELYLQHSRWILSALLQHATQKLTEVGAVVPEARGGFYLFPHFEGLRVQLERRGIRNGRALCKRLLDEGGVASLYGEHFGRPAEELSLRIALVDFDGAQALQALTTTRIATGEATSEHSISEPFLWEHCPRVMKAIEVMCSWLSEE